MLHEGTIRPPGGCRLAKIAARWTREGTMESRPWRAGHGEPAMSGRQGMAAAPPSGGPGASAAAPGKVVWAGAAPGKGGGRSEPAGQVFRS